MLEITPVQDKKQQEEICNKCNMEFNTSTLAYMAYENNCLLGAVQFIIKKGYAEIYDIRNADNIADMEVLIILGRAVFNFLESCGIINVFANGEFIKDEKLLKSIGFKKNNDDKWCVNLNEFFSTLCHHK